MIRDARRDRPPAAADVVIVGSGAAGITLALELIGSPLDVVLLEAGGTRFDRTVQSNYRAGSVAPWTHFRAELGRRRAFGGTTAIWGGRCIPFDPVDFRKRDWVPYSGWPISYEEVDAHIPRAMEILEAGKPEFTVATLEGDDGPLAEVDSSELDLGRVERFSLPINFAKHYRHRLDAARNLSCYLHAPVLRIMAENGVTTGVETPHGPIRAGCVVVGTGGIETARLLLASGLGNDNVGRFYQSHVRVEFGTMTLRETRRAAYQRSRDGIWCRRHIAFTEAAQEKHRLPQGVVRPNNPPVSDPEHRDPVLSLVFLVKNVLIAEYRNILVGNRRAGRAGLRQWGATLQHLRNVAFGIVPLAAFLGRWTRLRILPRRKLPSAFIVSPTGRYGIDLQLEQVPNPESRIRLGSETDAHGVPRVEIDWQTCTTDRENLAHALAALRDAGIPGQLEFDTGGIDPATVELFPVPAHHIGTARMADTPETGVCNANAEVFGVRGLFVAGSALFPTGGYANPTLVIVALTLRLAQFLKENAARFAGNAAANSTIADRP